jgi:hypothetical protein
MLCRSSRSALHRPIALAHILTSVASRPVNAVASIRFSAPIERRCRPMAINNPDGKQLHSRYAGNRRPVLVRVQPDAPNFPSGLRLTMEPNVPCTVEAANASRKSRASNVGKCVKQSVITTPSDLKPGEPMRPGRYPPTWSNYDRGFSTRRLASPSWNGPVGRANRIVRTTASKRSSKRFG